MRAIRTISVAALKPLTFKSWADEIMNYLGLMCGNNLNVILTIKAMIAVFRPNRETSVRWSESLKD